MLGKVWLFEEELFQLIDALRNSPDDDIADNRYE